MAFISKLLDDLGAVVKVDEKRVYACGMSNGGMMCYRLAAELSDRIAAIAPVAGTIAIDESKPKRPVPVIHFHGTKDNLVPFEVPRARSPRSSKLKGVEDSIQTWVKLNGCEAEPKTDTLSKDGDEMKVTRKIYGGGKDGAEVVLIVIEDGGHTWPGQQPPVGFIGKSAKNISANDLMWEFFQTPDEVKSSWEIPVDELPVEAIVVGNEHGLTTADLGDPVGELLHDSGGLIEAQPVSSLLNPLTGRALAVHFTGSVSVAGWR